MVKPYHVKTTLYSDISLKIVKLVPLMLPGTNHFTLIMLITTQT